MPDLKLSSLPGLQPPEDVFAAAYDKAMAARQHRRQRRHWLSLAAAAVVLVTVGLLTGLAVQDNQYQRELSDWIAYSQELESQLRRIESRSQAMNGHRAATVSTLASEVAEVDFALSRQPEARNQIRLWQTRAELLNQLVSVHAGGNWVNQPDPGAPIVTLDRAPRNAVVAQEI